MARTFYEVLGVPEDASQEAIEEAYREKVKECHPDVSDDPDAGETFKDVVQAEEVLGDPDEREKYDQLGHDSYVRRVEGQNVSGSEESPWTTGKGRSGGAGGFDPREAAAGTAGGTDSGGTTAQTGATGGSKASASEGFGPGADRQHATGQASGSSHGFGTAADRQHGTGGVGKSAENRWDQRSYSAGGHKDSADSGYSVHDWDEEDISQDTVTVTITQETLLIAGGMFVMYPAMVWASISPGIHLAFNVVAGLVTLLAVGYLLTVPKVAIAVFGSWSVIAPVAVLTVTSWTLPTSLLAIGACWIPFAYAVTVAYLVRPD